MLKKWMSMDKREVIYKSQDDSIGSISKTQPANKVAEITNTRILPASKTGQKPARKDAPKKIKSGSKKIMKLNTDYAKQDEDMEKSEGPWKKGKHPKEQGIKTAADARQEAIDWQNTA